MLHFIRTTLFARDSKLLGRVLSEIDYLQVVEAVHYLALKILCRDIRVGPEVRGLKSHRDDTLCLIQIATAAFIARQKSFNLQSDYKFEADYRMRIHRHTPPKMEEISNCQVEFLRELMFFEELDSLDDLTEKRQSVMDIGNIYLSYLIWVYYNLKVDKRKLREIGFDMGLGKFV